MAFRSLNLLCLLLDNSPIIRSHPFTLSAKSMGISAGRNTNVPSVRERLRFTAELPVITDRYRTGTTARHRSISSGKIIRLMPRICGVSRISRRPERRRRAAMRKWSAGKSCCLPPGPVQTARPRRSCLTGLAFAIPRYWLRNGPSWQRNTASGRRPPLFCPGRGSPDSWRGFPIFTVCWMP